MESSVHRRRIRERFDAEEGVLADLRVATLRRGRLFLIAAALFSPIVSLAVEITEDTIVTDDNVAYYAAASEITIDEDATLWFKDLSNPMSLSARLRGAGRFVVTKSAESAVRITLRGDASDFTGGFYFTNVLVTAESPASIGSAPFTYKNEKASVCSYLNGSGKYLCPLDITAGVTTGYGFEISEGVILDAPVFWRSGRLRGPGKITGVVKLGSKTCYPGGDIHFAGGITASSTYGLMGDGEGYFIDAPIGALSTVRATKATVGFGCANAVSADQILQIAGVSYGKWGSYDLHGYDQTVKTITFNSNPPNTDELYLKTYLTSSESPAMLTLTSVNAAITYRAQVNGHLSLCAAGSKTITLYGEANTTDGVLISSNGTIAISKTAVFPHLSKLIAKGSGVLNVHTANVNPGIVEVELEDTSKFKILEGVSLEVARAKVDGAYLAPGVYTKTSSELGNHVASDFGGELKVVNGAPVVEGETFVWVGGSDGNLISSAANWKDGSAPCFDGTERLVFGGGNDNVVVAGEIMAYSIDVVSDRSFSILSGGADARIRLMKSLVVSNSVQSGTVVLNLNCPVALEQIPQTWIVTPSAELNDYASISGRCADSVGLLVQSFGRVRFYADNSSLETSLVLTNCNSRAGQPQVYHRNGLGSTSRFTTIYGAWPQLNAGDAGAFTNAVPLCVCAGSTDAWGNLNEWLDASFYQEGTVKLIGGGVVNVGCQSPTHFTGGVFSEDGSGFTVRPKQNKPVWIEGGLALSGAFETDYSNDIYLGSADNNWSALNIVKSAVHCGEKGSLCPTSAVSFGSGNWAYWAENFGTLDVGGECQKTTRISVNWNPRSTTMGKEWGKSFAILTSSAAGAELEVTSDYNDVLPMKVTGTAGLHFNGTGAISFTNFLSTTTGDLRISQGEVRFLSGAGWSAASNVVIRGGTLAFGKGTGPCALGLSQGRSKARLVRDAGALEIEEGEQVTVRLLAQIDGDRPEGVAYFDAGVYGGADAGLDAAHTLDWIRGNGTIRVLRSSEHTGLLLFVR